MSVEWADWESGDCVFAPDRPDAILHPDEVIRRVALGFRQVAIDRAAGDRWAEARVEAAERAGYRGLLLDAERALVGRVALVSASDGCCVWVRFHLTADAGCLELHYDPPEALGGGRRVAVQLARLLGYEFAPGGAEAEAEPGAAPDPAS